jgi:AcrR family transcriptional regulator
MSASQASEPAQVGLRERKKERTRELIAETARRLFAERGFERVTISEIARAAEVSEQTVFNYFPTKEDLVYWRLERFEGEMLSAIRDRPGGQTVIDAFGRFILVQRGLLANPDPTSHKQLLAITRMITDSPALLARETAIFDRFTSSLAAAIAEDMRRPADDVEAWVIANALMGVHRVLIAHSRRRLLAGAKSAVVSREVSTKGKRALATLERGFGSIAVR